LTKLFFRRLVSEVNKFGLKKLHNSLAFASGNALKAVEEEDAGCIFFSLFDAN